MVRIWRLRATVSAVALAALLSACGSATNVETAHDPQPAAGQRIEPTATGVDARTDLDYLFDFLAGRLSMLSPSPNLPRLVDFLPNTHARYVDGPEPIEAGELAPGWALVVGTISNIRYGDDYHGGIGEGAEPSLPPGANEEDFAWFTLHFTINRQEEFGDLPPGELTSGIAIPRGIDLQRVVNGLYAIGPAVLALDNTNPAFPDNVWALAFNAEYISPLGADDAPLSFPLLERSFREAFIREAPTLASLRQRSTEPARYRSVVRFDDGRNGWIFADGGTNDDTTPTTTAETAPTTTAGTAPTTTAGTAPTTVETPTTGAPPATDTTAPAD